MSETSGSKTKFVLAENNDEAMAFKQFEWHVDDKNNAVISWDWPTERTVKLALVFEQSDDGNFPDISELLQDGHSHEIVVRDLASRISVSITEGKKKFLVCPGYFDDSRNVIVYKPVYETDWLYKKATINAQVFYKSLPLSNFHKVNMRITSTDMTLMPSISNVLTYIISERGRKLGQYPLDPGVMSGNGHFYIKKDQTVSFKLDEGYAHLLELQ